MIVKMFVKWLKETVIANQFNKDIHKIEQLEQLFNIPRASQR